RGDRVPGGFPFFGRGPGISGIAARCRRQSDVRAGVPGLPARPPLHRLCRRGAGGHGAVRARAGPAGAGPCAAGANAGDRAAQP
ncbi:histidine kinase, partial [Enterococcus hirae]